MSDSSQAPLSVGTGGYVWRVSEPTPQTAPPAQEPWLPLFDVRAELEKVTDVRYFDRWIELAVQRAERDGDFARFRADLRGFLRSALVGQNQELVVGTPYEERDALLDRMVEQWAAQHPQHTSFIL